ncbi:MAG: cupin domain-containing protein [Treponema sp.]|jgi:mannose-6-phosphate isomerase-like protein (cupin superfamily)|nr:cupin domain-containing protein [Treponema sp.]
MVNQRGDMRKDAREMMRGGEGTVQFTYLVDCEKEKNIRLLAELTLPPGASIGYHRHDNETEYFVILSGAGEVNDNGVVKPVKPGDTIITGNGDSHSIKNTGGVPLVFHAIIVTC